MKTKSSKATAARSARAPTLAASAAASHAASPAPSQAPTPTPAAPALNPAQALNPAALSDGLASLWQVMSGMGLNNAKLAPLQSEYVREATALWNQALGQVSVGPLAAPATAPVAIKDRRFASPSWAASPSAALTAQMYLLNSRTLMQMAESVDGDAKTKARLRFAVQQYVDASSPSNYLATNADALNLALQTQGNSLSKGMQQLAADVQKGHVSQTDESVFEVGRNVATTEGAVVFENELFQLIEYKPLTAQVYERPMLFVPPCINKYYILDLQPSNSVIRYTVEQGHRLFVVSWRNPDDSLKTKTWDDYIEQGPLAAISSVQTITGAKSINALGFCVGGTILSTALAVLAARGQHPVHSTTLLTTLLDFSDTGILDIFIDENSVRLREMTIGEQAPMGPGMLKGKELATTFSFLRPNDLVWNYVVGNYLKGEAPPPFDLLYWNGDSTNLPGPMYCWYLRHTYLQNELRQPGALTVCGEKVDLGAIRSPFYIYGSREDHIVPWTGAYASVALIKAPRRFVLGASGHIAGVVNPPVPPKRSHWTNDALPGQAADWFSGATEHAGSWWTDWSRWLVPMGGKKVPAPKAYGGHGLKAIEPAPGRYVKAKAT